MIYTKEQIDAMLVLDSSSTPINTPVVLNSHDLASVLPLMRGSRCIYLGEVAGMTGHVVIADTHGGVWWGYHDDNFSIIPEHLL
jgi:hypothetical protein